MYGLACSGQWRCNMEEDFACLYIIRGEPYRSGTCVNLRADETLVGRVSHLVVPELAFTNAFVSRKHFIIRKENDKAVLYDLGSRHGTEINGSRLTPHTPYSLNNFDIIKLAKGMIVLHFSFLFAEQTLEFEPLSMTKQMEIPDLQPKIYWEKRECLIGNKRIPMSDKEYLFIRVLHEKINQLVTLEEIRSKVWPERSLGANGFSDVSHDELNALVYRIRKKYGKDTFLISAVRGNGYVLESELISS